MKLTFRKIDRSNWRVAIEIKLRAGQEGFVSSPMKSLAAALVRQYGDHYDYTPMGIYNGETMIGFASTLCDPNSRDAYWIDDIMIDARFQGKGFGRPAVTAAIEYILRSYPRCEAIQLSCHRNNHLAAKLYQSMGFVATGELNVNSGEPGYKLAGAALRKYPITE